MEILTPLSFRMNPMALAAPPAPIIKQLLPVRSVCSFKAFKARVGVWGSVSENAYYDVIADKYALKK